MSAKIKTWQERCQTHPDHEGIVTHAMIHERMAEEIDDLREEVKRLNRAIGVLRRAMKKMEGKP